MNIFLIRHAISEANLDKSVHGKVADHAIKLANPLGIEQAQNAGMFLNGYFNINFPNEKARMWVSPYTRTRETASEIITKTEPYILDVRENIHLVEQQYGLFDGISDPSILLEIQQQHPNEWNYYQKQKKFEGKFWARMPLGESQFDVCLRVQQCFGTFQRDLQKHNIENIIIVAHGLSIRAFIMSWMHYPVEWFNNEENPNNCSIRLLQDNVDKGYIFEGFDKHKYKE